MSKRIAVVTGAGKGLGKEIAGQLSERGLDVIAATHAELDVDSDASVDAFAKAHPEIDVLVNNAGISVSGFDAAVARKTIETNFKGTVRVTEKLLPNLRAGARIVMMSSGMGELSAIPGKEIRDAFGAPAIDRARLMSLVDRFVDEIAAGTHQKSGWPSNAYRISKVAMNAYVRILARGLVNDERGIKVNAACPGWVRTRMGGSSAPRSVEDGAKTPVWLALLPDDGPMGGFFRDEHAIPW
jgi:carbonyl reductase 1